jgi:hypothetical protein
MRLTWDASVADVALSQKLAEELQYEKTTETSSGDPDFLQAFKQQGIWNVSSIPHPPSHSDVVCIFTVSVPVVDRGCPGQR